ncbi:MAG: DUF4124 domain-containing protein [Burkholderiales bacterium]|nr:DUF4124 domain-containing protein [Burkholderiales bacterium]
MKLTHLLLAATVTCICSGAMAQWQWIDKDGRKVFSDRAPPPDVADKNIVKRPTGRVAANPVPAADAPVADAGQPAAAPALVASAPKGVDKELEARKKQAADAEAAKRKADEERVTKAKVENCARAKQAKTTFESGVRVARTGPAGEREVMDDTARATELKRIQAIIDSDCR